MEYYNQMMRYIKRTKEEFGDAKHYATLAVHCKEKGDMANGKTYYEMASQELGHATNIHNMAVKYMNDWATKEQIPEWIHDKWDDAVRSYVKHVAKVKYMIAEFTA